MRDRGYSSALTRACACLLLACTVSCSDGPAEADSSNGQWYHATLTSQEGEQVPFFLRIPDDCAADTATIANGEERIAAPCEHTATAVAVDFPVYGTRIDAAIEPDGILTGAFGLDRYSGWIQAMAFMARPVAEPDPRLRFSPEFLSRQSDEETDGDDAYTTDTSVAGIWRMEFDLFGTAKGVLAQDADGVVTGTIDVPSDYGDMRFLAGNLHGQTLRLSTFDGAHYFLIEAELLPDGSMEGAWIRRDNSWDMFVAERSADFDAPDPLDRVRLLPGRDTLDLEHLGNAPYAGKPVIVEIFGTWCPNCNDHTPALVELYERHHDAGLEILGLAFEYTADQQYKEQRVREFVRRHGVQWEIVIIDWSLRDLAEEGFGGLTNIDGVPVTIFVNRDGTVHAVYTGFTGPATGDAHLAAKEQLDRLTREIIGSR